MATAQSPLTNAAGNAAASRFALGGIFFVAGLAMLSGAGYETLRNRHDIAVGTTANGTVTDLFQGSDSDGGTVYYPRVRFVTQSGDTIEFTGSNGTSPPAFEVGETVSVLYDPISPGNARIDTFFQLWFTALILGFLGLVFTAVGGGAIIALCARPTERRCRGRRLHRMPSVRRLRDSRRMTLEPVMVYSSASRCRRRRSRGS
jgi:hypothetical protein